MLLFLLLSYLNFFNKSVFLAFLGLVFWLFTYGLMHCLIQIRFGLSGCIVVYLYSLFFKRPYDKKLLLYSFPSLGFFAIFSHYSSIFSIFSLLLIWVRKAFYYINSGKIVHILFFIILLSFKFEFIYHLLPNFLIGRIGLYLNNDDYETVSSITRLISFFCYTTLVLSPKLKIQKLNDLRVYGALGFIPYLVIPEVEILVRLGIAFQYLLIPYLLLTLSYRRVLFYSTIPVLLFYFYKVFSSANAFIGYLN